MGNGLAHRLATILGVVTLCAALFGPSQSWAAPQFDLPDLRSRLNALTELLRSDPAARLRPLVSLLDEVGLPRPFQSDKPAIPPLLRGRLPDGPATSEMQNLRLALAILAQSHGGKDNQDVMLAQGPRGLDAVSFRGGTVTLNDISAALVRHGQAPMGMDQTGARVLRAPIVLWEDTVLKLGPMDRISLSRPDGAFLLSFGKVEVDGSRLSVQGGENAYAPDFVPFLAIGGGGALDMRNAHVTGLGFGQTGKFSGVAVAAHPLMRAVGRSLVTDSVFEDMMTLSITGTAGAEVSRNRFFDMRHNALLISGAPMTRASGNLFWGDAVTNAIRVLNGSSDTRIEGNYVLEGDRAAIIVEGNSSRVRVTGNVLSDRTGGGIRFYRTRCGVAAGNVILDMRQKGIEVRTARDTTVSANLIAGSRSAAIWVSAQPKGAQTHLSDNVLMRNDAGINTATGGVLYLDGNDFSDQFPRLVDGDITLQNGVIVRDLRGAVPVRMTAGSSEPMTPVEFDCAGGLGQ